MSDLKKGTRPVGSGRAETMGRAIVLAYLAWQQNSP